MYLLRKRIIRRERSIIVMLPYENRLETRDHDLPFARSHGELWGHARRIQHFDHFLGRNIVYRSAYVLYLGQTGKAFI